LTEEDFEVISDEVLVPIKSVIPPQKKSSCTSSSCYITGYE
jgi:hypothetical protein